MQSLRLRLDSGEIVLAADDCYFCRTLNRRRLPRYRPDHGARLATLDRLEAPGNFGARISFGYDPEFWRSGPQVPAATHEIAARHPVRSRRHNPHRVWTGAVTVAAHHRGQAFLERAAKLAVPIYIHPGLPHPVVIEAYYKDYVQSHPGILRAAWGFTVETATQGVRFVLSGVFDAHPNLKIILRHMGEGLPFLLWRISHGLRATMKEKTFRDIFCEHFWITTSGFFSSRSGEATGANTSVGLRST